MAGRVQKEINRKKRTESRNEKNFSKNRKAN